VLSRHEDLENTVSLAATGIADSGICSQSAKAEPSVHRYR
jgi:hypothetical protein